MTPAPGPKEALEFRLAMYQRRLDDLLGSDPPTEDMELLARKGSLNYLRDCMRHLRKMQSKLK